MILNKRITDSNVKYGVVSLSGISNRFPDLRGQEVCVNNFYTVRINSIAYRIDGLTDWFRENHVSINDLIQIEIDDNNSTNIKLTKL